MQTYIPYQLRVKLKQIDPILDNKWQQQLNAILSATPKELHEKIEERYLKPKNIHWNYLTATFEFHGYIRLQDIPQYTQHPELLQLAKNVQSSFDYLETYQTDFQIADFLETVIHEMNQIELHEPQDIQAQLLLKKAFLYDAALIIRDLDFTVTTNHRNLDQAQIRSFIFEVFMKSEILGNWFAYILPSEYAQQKPSIFQDYFVHELHVRDFEIIDATDYYFIVSSSYDSRVSAYSIRRFLTEENFGVENKFYISGLVLDPKKLDQIDYIENFKQQMTQIIGIQRQMNPHIVELIESLHLYKQEQLLPQMKKVVDIQGFSTDYLVKEHLDCLEKDLCLQVLEPFARGLKQSVQQSDELEFCYLNLKRLMTELLHQFEALSQEPMLQFNPYARGFKYRLIAYLHLLVQRRAQVFVLFEDEYHYQRHLNAVIAPVQKIREHVNAAIEQSRNIQQQIRSLEREIQTNEKAGFFKRLLKKSENNQVKIEKLKKSLIYIQDRCYIGIISIQKQATQQSVYLEAKNLISRIDPKIRHYAFANGENGITRLPLLLQLPEDRHSFNMQNISLALNQEFVLTAKPWSQ